MFDFLKKDKWRYVMQGNLNIPVWTTQKDKQFITEGFNRVVWVYSCVGAISSAVSSVPWLLYRKGRAGRLIEVTDHPILTMLNNRANPYMSSKDFIDYWATYLAIEGKFYAEYSNPNMPTGLYPIYPHYVYPIPHRTEFIGGFEYRLDEPIRYNANELLWSKFNDPLDVYQGQSPLRALSRTIDTENEAVDWNKTTLQNAGIPAGVFQIQNPSPELSQRLEEEWQKRYGGGSNARKPLILNSDKASYMPLGLSPVDMDFLNQRKINRIEICSAFGVPSQIVGDPEGQTYSNYGEAQKAFWENTVISKYLEHMRLKLQSDLLPRYADNLELRYDLSNVGALKENEDKKATRVLNLWKAGLITRNEGRYALDYEEDLNGNLYFNELTLSAPAPAPAPAPMLPITTEEQMPVAEEVETEEVETEEVEPIQADQEEVEPMEAEEEEKEESEGNNITIIIQNLIENALKKKEVTNYPKVGDSETITLKNSSYELIPLDYAENIRENYPSIWDEGGNIQGNDTYRVIKRIREENKSADELTDNDKEIIRMREAWSARHEKDFQLSGVVAQIKWHMIGSRGFDHMRKVIDEAKDKLDKKQRMMKVEEQREYYKSFDRQREKFVTKTRSQIEDHFEKERKAVLKSIRNASPSQMDSKIDAVIDADKTKLQSILTAMNIAVIKEFGDRVTNELEKNKKMATKQFDEYSPSIQAWIAKNIANAVVLVSDTTKRDIKKIINDAIQLGWGVGAEDQENTIAWAIGNLYLDQIIPNRSETIARTEVITASNQGSLESARQFGVGLKKYWIPTFDDSTRDTHKEMANKKPIGLDEEFLVGGSRGQAPASITLSAKERINCRCTIGYTDEFEE